MNENQNKKTKGIRSHHVNIPIFIPHLGCPNNCVFCNQRLISGKREFVKESVREEIERSLSTIDPDTCLPEIAFFGGSFTGIDRELMIYLLGVAQEYIDSGRAGSIRMSTRPDYISDEIMKILSDYTVGTIELGIQSMDENVLRACKRGHSVADSVNACRLIKQAGYSLIGQMMIGLPGADNGSEIRTAENICLLGADGARVYPTVVFRETELCNMAKSGEYIPLSNEEATLRTGNVLKVFDHNGVPCIRVGLCASENLSDDSEVFGGANHSAVGEMAMSLVFRDNIEEAINSLAAVPKNDCRLTVYVPRGCTSKAAGQKRSNKNYFAEKYGIKNIKILEDPALTGYNVHIAVTGSEK